MNNIIGAQFVHKDNLKMAFVVVSQVIEDNFVVINYGKIIINQGRVASVLNGSQVLSKEAIHRDYIKFDSPEYHQAMKILEKSALG
jgi:isopentenyl phosphate kinase